MAITTIVDVAELAGVSIKTVSRVLNHEANVREETRARVFSAVEKLGYRPNISARALAGRRAYLIGLFYDNPVATYVATTATGATNAARARGYHLMVEEVRGDAEDLAVQVRSIISSIGLDGVVLTPPVTDSKVVLDLLDEANIPYVRIAPDNWLGRSAQVRMDDREAARQMTHNLWALGHRNIAFIEGPAGHVASHARREGFLQALVELGATGEPLIEHGMFDARSGAAAGERLLALDPRPTAIFAGNDDMALGVMGVALAAGLKLPSDLSVAGFDDSPVAQALWPPLTTVRQPLAEMAATAVDLLIGKSSQGEEPADRMLDFEIIMRQSTAPAPS